MKSLTETETLLPILWIEEVRLRHKKMPSDNIFVDKSDLNKKLLNIFISFYFNSITDAAAKEAARFWAFGSTAAFHFLQSCASLCHR